MAVLEDAIVDRLTDDYAGTAALIGARCFAMVKPQDEKRTCVVYQKISGVRVIVGGSDSGLAHPRFQFRLVAPTYAAVKALAIQVTAALGRWGMDTTNGWTHSEQLDNAAWSKVRASISADAVAAPDGATTADKIVEDSANNDRYVQPSVPTMTDDTDQAVSLFAKAAERSIVYIKTRDKSGGTTEVTWFNLATGAIGTQEHTTARITALADSWYRCEVVFDSGNTGSSQIVRIGPTTADNTEVYQGDGSSGLYVWGLQFEADQPFVSSYIQTVASAVTRGTIHSFPLNEFDGPTEPSDDGKGKLYSVLTDYEIWHVE